MKNRIIFVLAIIAIFVVSTSTVDAWCLWGIIGNTCGVKGDSSDESFPGADEKRIPGGSADEPGIPSVEPPSSELPIPGTPGTTPPTTSEDPIPSTTDDPLDVLVEAPKTTSEKEDGVQPDTPTTITPTNNDLSVGNLDASGKVQISNDLDVPLSIDSSHDTYNYINLGGEVAKRLGFRFDFPGEGQSFLIWDDNDKKFKFFAGGENTENIKMTISEEGDVITGSNTFKRGYKAGKARLEVVDEVNDESYIRISNKPEGNTNNNVAGFIASAEGMNIYIKAYSPTYAEDETKQRLAELGTGAGHNAPLAINVGGWEVARFHPGRRNNDGEVTRSPSIESNGDFVIRLSPKKYPIRKEVEDDEDEEDEEEYNV